MDLEGYLCPRFLLGRGWETEPSIARDTLVDGPLASELGLLSQVVGHPLKWLIARCLSSRLLLSLLSLVRPTIFPFLYPGVCHKERSVIVKLLFGGSSHVGRELLDT